MLGRTETIHEKGDQPEAHGRRPLSDLHLHKKFYQEQFSFNQSISQKLVEAYTLLDDSNYSVQELIAARRDGYD